MTWHLKDRELEKKLQDISKGRFLTNLRQHDDEIFVSFWGKIVCIDNGIEGLCRKFNHEIYLSIDEVEDVADYNPNAWNDYPKVTPPEGVPMSVESVYGQCAYRECAIFDHGFWKTERDGKPTEFLLIGQVKRFRPWGY